MTRSRLKALCWLALLLAEPSWLAAAEPAASAEGRVWRKPSDVFLSTLATLDEQPPNLEYSELRLKMGDDPRWAQATWDDRDWPEMPTYSSIPVRSGIFWLRYRLRGGEPGERLPSGYLITIVAAYELYWDGHRIGESGRPANTEAEEVPGPLDRIFEIPISLRGEGEHVLALRMSSHRSGFPSPTTYLQCFSGSPAYLAKLFLPLSIVPASAAATMAVLALVTVLLWLMATRRAALPWFFGLCLSIAIMQGLLAMRFITAYNYDWAYPMVLTRSILAGVIGFFLLAFVLVHFDLSRRRWWILMLVAAYGIASYSPQNRAGTHEATLLLTALGMALLVTARAAFVERRKHAWWVALGILATIILGLMRTRAFGLGEFVPRFLPTALCLLTVAWIQVLAERRQAREAQLNSARLEIELLKKNIQPHFLFNTLTTISEVIEHDPKGAVQLIDDLADGFRALSRMSGEKSVLLSQELELCRMHLRTLGTRMGITCALQTEGIDEKTSVPPAIFLTLIENGFAHQRVEDGPTIFSLQQTASAENRISFAFFSPGKIIDATERAKGGTGLRYVKARLEESFPDRWRFQHHAVDGGWETIIEFG